MGFKHLWFNLFGFNRLMAGWLPVALGIGSMLLGNLGKNKAQNREAENNAAMQQNNQQLDLFRTQQQALLQALLGQSNEQINQGRLDLDQRRYNDKSALLGSILQNLQPVKFSGLSPQLRGRMPQISGGLSPELISAAARQFGGNMQQNALGNQSRMGLLPQLKPTDFMGGVMPAPKLQGYKGPGTGESILGLLGMGLSAAAPYVGQSRGPQMNNQLGQAAPTMPGFTIPRGVLG